ncbi:Hypothetical predicted protein [Octopus vulgaris]|uniref:Uncharacterized protein n=1 Tax=Octopus vulgaris TaxID=6645 RepID=A0AA36F326_OCTVU|nr:Hypothetical predicted protein [Octopus vulgaris]
MEKLLTDKQTNLLLATRQSISFEEKYVQIIQTQIPIWPVIISELDFPFVNYFLIKQYLNRHCDVNSQNDTSYYSNGTH